ncbi:MAG: hypothetical protein NTU73_05780 [Ignavibacteriae bacterium]|nr:hypothetical protein [Ignavibacteriota bacterium]
MNLDILFQRPERETESESPLDRLTDAQREFLKLDNLLKTKIPDTIRKNRYKYLLSDNKFKEKEDDLKLLSTVIFADNKDIKKGDFVKAINILMSAYNKVEPILLNSKQTNKLWKELKIEAYKIICKDDMREEKDEVKTKHTSVITRLTNKIRNNKQFKYIIGLSFLLLISFILYFWFIKQNEFSYKVKIHYSSSYHFDGKVFIKYSILNESNILVEKEYFSEFGYNDSKVININGRKLKFEISTKEIDCNSIKLEIWKDTEVIFNEQIGQFEENPGEMILKFKEN